MHVVMTEPRGIRGNHYHPRGTEILTVMGPALVRTKTETDTTDVHVPAREAYQFFIPPGISHAIQNTGSEPGVLVAFNSEIHEPKSPDVVRDIILE